MNENVSFITQAAHEQFKILADFNFKTNWSRPFMVLIEPTLRCPMRCKFCDLPFDLTYPKAKELKLEDWQRIISELRNYLPLVREIFISGGEPFLRPDMSDILDYTHSLGIGTRMVTIGAFCTPRVLDRLIASPMSWLKFSMHSAVQSVHDEIVGRAVYTKVMKAIRYLHDNSYLGNIGFLTTVVKQNVEALPDILHLAQDIGVNSVFFRPLFGNTAAMRTFNDLVYKHEDCVINNEKQIYVAVQHLKELKKIGLPIANSIQQLDLLYMQTTGKNKGLPNCHMMYESIYIRPNGDVEICGHMSLGTMGNLQENSLGDILESQKAFAARHAVSRQCRCEGNAFVRKTLSEKVQIVADHLTK